MTDDTGVTGDKTGPTLDDLADVAAATNRGLRAIGRQVQELQLLGYLLAGAVIYALARILGRLNALEGLLTAIPEGS